MSMYFVKEELPYILSINQFNIGDGNSVDPSSSPFPFTKLSASSLLSHAINYGGLPNIVDWGPMLSTVSLYDPSLTLPADSNTQPLVRFDIYVATRGYLLPESKSFTHSSIMDYAKNNILFIPGYYAVNAENTTASFTDVVTGDFDINFKDLLDAENLLYLDNIPVNNKNIGDLTEYLSSNINFSPIEDTSYYQFSLKNDALGQRISASYSDSPDNFTFINESAEDFTYSKIQDALLDGTTKICIVYEPTVLDDSSSLNLIKSFLNSITFKTRLYFIATLAIDRISLDISLIPNFKFLIESNRAIRFIESVTKSIEDTYLSNIFYAKSFYRGEAGNLSISGISTKDAVNDFYKPLDLSSSIDGTLSTFRLVSKPYDQTYSLKYSQDSDTLPEVDLNYKETISDI